MPIFCLYPVLEGRVQMNHGIRKEMILKLFNRSLYLILSFFSVSVLAAELTLPGSVALLALDGKKNHQSGVLTLPEGKHQLVFRYEEALRFGTRKKKYQSSPLIVSVQLPEAAEVVLRHSRFRDYSAADSAFLNDKVEWQLENAQGALSDLQPAILPGNPGLLPYQDIEAAVLRYNQQNSVAEMPRLVRGQQAEIMAGQTENHHSKTHPFSDDFTIQIKSWYLQASDAERKALLKWMIEQQ